MSFADQLRNNYQPEQAKNYLKDVRYIVRTILKCAEEKSRNGFQLSGFYSYGGYDEPEGIYEDVTGANSDRLNAVYFHPEDFGSYRNGILENHKSGDTPIISEADSKRALKEIREQLIKNGFKNVTAEERNVRTQMICCGQRKRTFMEMRKKGKYDSDQMPVYAEMPLYALYIRISW